MTKQKEIGSTLLCNKGNSLYQIGEYEEAIACYDKAIEFNYYDIEAYANKGIVLATLDKHEEAIACYDKAIELNPSKADLYCLKGASLIDLKEKEITVKFKKQLTEQALKLQLSLDKIHSLTKKLAINEEKILALQTENEELKADKIELRNTNKIIVKYNENLQKEKELFLKEKDSFLIHKKVLQDLNTAKDNELTELNHAHLDTPHCTIVGHCDNTNHSEFN